MALTWEIYIDLLTGDGTPDDDLSPYWRGTDFVQGMRSGDQHVADIGRCTIVLRNTDMRFSRDNAQGPYFGNLVKGRAVLIKCINDTGTAIDQFRGKVEDWRVVPGTVRGTREAVLVATDLLSEMQSGDITLSLMQNFQIDTVVEMITNAAFKANNATSFLEFIGPVNDADTVGVVEGAGWVPTWSSSTTLGIQTYTFKSVLSNPSVANEVLIETDTDGTDITPENLAAAINRDIGEGSAYSTGTNRNAGFTANVRARVGIDAADQDNWINLRETGTAYDKLSTSFEVQTDTITTNYVWLYLRKQGSPTGTATIKFIMNSRGLPDDVQYTAIEGDFSEVSVDGSGDWLRVELDDYLTFRKYQRYHVELSTDRAAHAVNYIEWGEDVGVDNKNAENTAGTWTSFGNSFVWCIPGRVDLDARWRGSLFNGLVLASSNTTDVWWSTKDIAAPNVFSGGTDAPSGLTSFTADPDTMQIIGDEWLKSERIDAKRALRDTCTSGGGFIWCAEDGTITYQPRNYLFERIATAPALTLTNTVGADDMLIRTEQRLYNRVKVSFSERREVANTVIARSDGSIEIPPNVKETPQDYSNESGSDTSEVTLGARFNPNDDVERTTASLPFVDDGTGIITGATAIIQPVPGTDFTLTTEAGAGNGRDATYLAQTRGGGMQIPVAVLGGEIEATMRSTTGITSLFVNDLTVRGTALKTMNPQEVVREDLTSIADHGLREKTIRLASLTGFGPELAESIAEYELGRGKDERTIIQDLFFSGNTMLGDVKLYSLQIGDVVSVTEDQTAISGALVMVVGRRVSEHIKDKTPQLTLITRPLSDQTYLIIENATYGDLPGRLAI